MYINLNLHTAKEALVLFKSQFFPSISHQHKKILAVAFAALGLLATAYLIKHYWFNARSVVKEDADDDSLHSKKISEVFSKQEEKELDKEQLSPSEIKETLNQVDDDLDNKETAVNSSTSDQVSREDLTLSEQDKNDLEEMKAKEMRKKEMMQQITQMKREKLEQDILDIEKGIAWRQVSLDWDTRAVTELKNDIASKNMRKKDLSTKIIALNDEDSSYHSPEIQNLRAEALLIFDQINELMDSLKLREKSNMGLTTEINERKSLLKEKQAQLKQIDNID